MKLSKEKIKRYFKDGLIILIVMTISANILSFYRSRELNKEMLHIKTFQLLNNVNYTVDTSKPLMIHFWASWCPTCKLEADNIQRVSKKFQVITIAVNSGNDAQLQQYLQKHHYTFMVVNDKDAKLAKEFQIAGYPTTFIYDKEGNLQFGEVGYTSSLGLYLRLLYSEF
jgi:thiol-disulfide isomerase/thioredoxin